jgi:hypothetical protein
MPKPKAVPDPVEVEVVQKLIDQAKAADAEEALRYDALVRLRGRRAANDKELLADPIYLRALQNHQDAVRANFDAHNKAIRGAVEVYELTPPVIDFSGDSRAALNFTSRSWLPRYSIREKVDKETGGARRRTPKELSDELNDGGIAAAATWDNGEISLFNQAFSSPAELAITIYHETSHWIDGVAKPGGFKRSDSPAVRYRTEQRAFEHSAALARSMGVDATRFDALANTFKDQAAQAEAENLPWERVQFAHPNWLMKTRSASYSLAAAPADEERAGEEVLRQGIEQAKEAVDRSRRAQAIIGGAGRPTAEPVRVDPISTSPDRKPSRHSSNSLGVIKQIAIKVCMTPAVGISEDLTWIQWADVARMGDLGRWPEAPGDCERRVYLRLAEFARTWAPGRMISSAEVQAAALAQVPQGSPSGGSAPRTGPDHNPVWGKIGIPKR